ncbi:hypothetical protein JCM19233_3619 [Vibrio astriarenae]|nr:hypothetical protein JCM19233_3619 [Vibrio sp. C7]
MPTRKRFAITLVPNHSAIKTGIPKMQKDRPKGDLLRDTKGEY